MSNTLESVSGAAPRRVSVSAFAVLKEPGMRWYLGGQLVSLVGSLLQSAVILLFVASAMRLSQEQAATASGVFWALGLVPGAILGPFAGTFLDAWNKRAVLIVTALLGAMQAVILAHITAAPDHVALWELYGLSIFMGFVNAIDGPGRNAIVKDIVRDESHMSQAQKMFTSLYNVAQIAGPGFAGYLVLAFGYPTTFVLNALSFLVLIVTLLKLRLRHEGPDAVERREALPVKTLWRKVADGYDYAFSEPRLRACIVLTSLVSVFGFSYYVLLAVFNKYALHGNEVSYSHLTASQGIGALSASAIVIAIGKRWHARTTVIGMMLGGASLIGLSLASDARLAMICVFGAGAGFVTPFTVLRSSMVDICDKRKIGVVLGLAFSFFYGGMMVGTFAIGPLAHLVGMRGIICCCGIALLALAQVTRSLSSVEGI